MRIKCKKKKKKPPRKKTVGKNNLYASNCKDGSQIWTRAFCESK